MILEIDTGDTAWVLTSAALVLLMTPGLALFYGGMVRAKGVLNMMMMSFITMGTIGVLWVLYGYSLAFGNSFGFEVGPSRTLADGSPGPSYFGLLGNPADFAGLQSILNGDSQVFTLPSLAFVAFQSVFAIIAVALVSGALADRVKFGAWTLFTVLWGTIVYFPVAGWVFSFDGGTAEHGGWIANWLGALDFAGGTAIHINAGTAALALALVIGPRIGFGSKSMRPHNMTLVMIGAGLLWFGWFGFNAGSAVGANWWAATAWVNTLAATAAAMLGWLVVERFRDGHPTSLGAASGVVAGLVAITPAAGSVSPLGSILVGVIAGVACAYAVGLKYKLGYDDSLDVVGVHLVGGLVGTLLIGFLADPASPAATAGLFYGGGLDQLWRQAVGAIAVLVYSFVLTYLIGLLIKHTIGWRVSTNNELGGIDLAEHSEVGYDLSPVYYSSRVQRTLVLTADDLPESEKTGA